MQSFWLNTNKSKWSYACNYLLSRYQNQKSLNSGTIQPTSNKQTNVSICNYPVQQCATCSYNVAIRNKNALLHFQKTFPGYGTTVQKSITKSTQFPVLYLCEQHISTLISKDLQHRFQQLRNSQREYLFNEIQESLQRWPTPFSKSYFSTCGSLKRKVKIAFFYHY